MTKVSVSSSGSQGLKVKEVTVKQPPPRLVTRQRTVLRKAASEASACSGRALYVVSFYPAAGAWLRHKRRHLFMSLSISSWKLERIIKYWWGCNNRRWEFVEARKQNGNVSVFVHHCLRDNDAVSVQRPIRYLENCAPGQRKGSTRSLYISWAISPTFPASLTDPCWWLSQQAPDLLHAATWKSCRRLTIHKYKAESRAFCSMAQTWSSLPVSCHRQSIKFY